MIPANVPTRQAWLPLPLPADAEYDLFNDAYAAALEGSPCPSTNPVAEAGYKAGRRLARNAADLRRVLEHHEYDLIPVRHTA
jgi:hypothetical protein